MKAIPTKWDGIQFRSRLEAKWAAFFTGLGWAWSYEPFDLAGYIPDFILHLRTDILVEVKPLTYLDDPMSTDAIAKIRKSGWNDKLAIVVGALLFEHDEVMVIGRMFGAVDDGIMGESDYAVLGRCPTCEKRSLSAWYGIWQCQVCGVSNGDMSLPSQHEKGEIEMLWRKCGNEVQWNAD